MRPMWRKHKQTMTYELINRRTANSVCAFSTRGEAEAARNRYSAIEPDFKYDLMVVAFNDRGEVVENETPTPAGEAEATAHLVS